MTITLLFLAISLSRITAYSPHVGQTDSNPNMSACGKTVHNQIAVSRDLLKQFPCGTWVRIRVQHRGYKTSYIGKVNDVLNRRYRRSVDIMFKSRLKAILFGVKTGSIEKY